MQSRQEPNSILSAQNRRSQAVMSSFSNTVKNDGKLNEPGINLAEDSKSTDARLQKLDPGYLQPRDSIAKRRYKRLMGNDDEPEEED